MTILHIAIHSPFRRCFDYLPPDGVVLDTLRAGVRVQVPFRNKTTIGILIHVSTHTTVATSKLKTALEILDQEPIFSDTILSLLHWASKYYQHPIGEVFLSALPTLLRKGSSLLNAPYPKSFSSLDQRELKSAINLQLNQEQKAAVEQVSASFHQFGVYLLNGVTGSGKTEVYACLIEQALKQDKQVLVLVPEIGLTPQLSERLQERIQAPVVVMHSGLTEKARLNAWIAARQGASVIVGTRSAVFVPLLNPGLIIIDEEHDLSFKQQEGFRYSARDLAIIRAQKENIPILLGSATPSLESLANVQKERYTELMLPNRAGVSIMPRFYVVDVRAKPLQQGISSALLTAIETHLALSKQVLLFINRRGYAPVLLCHACGWMAVCKRCDARLTLHQKANCLMCHHCGFSKSIDLHCPSCSSTELLHVGLGTERIETILKKYFPNTEVIRIDRDTMRRKGAMLDALNSAKEGQGQILIGTQMIAKGHHFPNVTLVGILDVDGGFFSADFRATERMAQLLIQVAGRAGREAVQGEVYLQTHQPTHPLLQKLLQEGYVAFSKQLLSERQQATLPPFSYLALFRAEAVKAEKPMHFLKQVSGKAQDLMGKGIDILGPIPSPMQRKAGHYRAQLLLRAGHRSVLNQGLARLLSEVEGMKSGCRWSVEVDPLEVF
jgi:primosomal protein N' (replication factor Y) (superfamily II helicase)